jgi:hypothetical protein
MSRALNLTLGVLGCSILLIGGARAEIGTPTGPGGYYVSLEGGWQHVDGSKVKGFDPGKVVNGSPGDTVSISTNTVDGSSVVLQDGGSASGAADVLAFFSMLIQSGDASSFIASNGRSNSIAADEGGFGGLAFGYVFNAPLVQLVNRAEIYGTANRSDDEFKSFGAFALRNVDNSAAIGFLSIPASNTTGKTTQDIEMREIGLRLKSDHPGQSFFFSLNAEPFFINYEQETATNGRLNPFVLSDGTSVAGSANRHADVEADLFGTQLAIEAEAPMSGRLAWIGRGSAGVYYVDADGNFNSGGGLNVALPGVPLDLPEFFGRSRIKDSANDTGYRFGLETGVRLQLAPWARLAITGSVDHFTDLPTAILPSAEGDPAAHLGFDDLTDWRVGVRLTLATLDKLRL